MPSPKVVPKRMNDDSFRHALDLMSNLMQLLADEDQLFWCGLSF